MLLLGVEPRLEGVRAVCLLNQAEQPTFRTVDHHECLAPRLVSIADVPRLVILDIEHVGLGSARCRRSGR